MAVVLLAIGALVVWLIGRERPRHGVHLSPPPMVFLPPESAEPPIVRPPMAVREPPRAEGAELARPQLLHERPVAHDRSVVHEGASVESMALAGGASASPAAISGETVTLALNRRRAAGRPRSASDGLAAMGTLRVLPGRLVPEDRSLVRDDIRFIALDGAGEQRYTLGRAEGPLHEHIQVASPTVSRQHAVLVFGGGSWTIGNLSETNPVRVNGVEIADRQGVRLADGDLVEMGEVVLRFRS